MHEISTLEVSILSRELDASYSGFHIEKFYDLGEGRFRIKVRGNGKDTSLLVQLCRAVCPAQYIESAEQPSSFAMAVRKRITGFAIEGVSQLGSDRIIALRLRTGEARANLLLEMFGKGNLIITDQDMRITLAYSQRDYRDRSVRVGREYKPPSAPERRQPKTIMSYVSARADVGPIYVEDAIARAGLDPNSPLEGAGRSALDSIIDSLSRIGDMGATVYTDDSGIVDYSLGKLGKYGSLRSREFQTLKEALSFAYGGVSDEDMQDNPELRRLEASIARQRELVVSTLREAEAGRAAGKLVFERMGELNQLIESARGNRRMTAEELRSLFPDMKITDINLKDKTITLEI